MTTRIRKGLLILTLWVLKKNVHSILTGNQNSPHDEESNEQQVTIEI
jgi:hypothetical protein